jgi:hypothetical protein
VHHNRLAAAVGDRELELERLARLEAMLKFRRCEAERLRGGRRRPRRDAGAAEGGNTRESRGTRLTSKGVRHGTINV